MRVVRYTAMRSAARPLLALVLVAALSGAALATCGRLAGVDPRGRARRGPRPHGLRRDAARRRRFPAGLRRARHAAPSRGTGDWTGRGYASDSSRRPTDPRRRPRRSLSRTAGGAIISLPLDDVPPALARAAGGPICAPSIDTLTLDSRRPVSARDDDTVDARARWRAPSMPATAQAAGSWHDGRRHAGDWLLRRGVAWAPRSWRTLARAGLLTASRQTGAPDRRRASDVAASRLRLRLRSGASLRSPGRTGAPAIRTIRRDHGDVAQPPCRRPTRSGAPASYEFVQQPLYYVGAAAVLRAAGLASPGPVLGAQSAIASASQRGTEPTIFQHAAPPANEDRTPGLRLLRTRVAAHGARHDLVDCTAARDGHVRPARHCDRRRRPRLDSAMVRGDGRGLDRSAGDVAGAAAATLAIVRVAHGRSVPRLIRRLRAMALIFTGTLIGAAYAVKATTIFLVPMAVLACLLDGAIREGVGSGGRGLHGLARALTCAVRPVSLIGLGIAVAAGGFHSVPGSCSEIRRQSRSRKRCSKQAVSCRSAGPMPWTAEFWAHMRVMVFEPFWARFGSLGAGPFPGSRVWLVYGAASMLIALVACLGPPATGHCAGAARRFATPEARAVSDDVALAARHSPLCSGFRCRVDAGVAVCGVARRSSASLPGPASTSSRGASTWCVHWSAAPRSCRSTAPAALLVGARPRAIATRCPHLCATRRVAALRFGVTIAALSLAWLGVLRATRAHVSFRILREYAALASDAAGVLGETLAGQGQRALAAAARHHRGHVQHDQHFASSPASSSSAPSPMSGCRTGRARRRASVGPRR